MADSEMKVQRTGLVEWLSQPQGQLCLPGQHRNLVPHSCGMVREGQWQGLLSMMGFPGWVLPLEGS